MVSLTLRMVYCRKSGIRNGLPQNIDFFKTSFTCSFLFSYLNVTFCLLGDGSCFIVQQDLDYLIELTGADSDPVYKVQACEEPG